jgi:hypothetical protein
LPALTCFTAPQAAAETCYPRALGGASGALAPDADFEGAPKRQSPTGHTLIRSTVHGDFLICKRIEWLRIFFLIWLYWF